MVNRRRAPLGVSQETQGIPTFSACFPRACRWAWRTQFLQYTERPSQANQHSCASQLWHFMISASQMSDSIRSACHFSISHPFHLSFLSSSLCQKSQCPFSAFAYVSVSVSLKVTSHVSRESVCHFSACPQIIKCLDHYVDISLLLISLSR